MYKVRMEYKIFLMFHRTSIYVCMYVCVCLLVSSIECEEDNREIVAGYMVETVLTQIICNDTYNSEFYITEISTNHVQHSAIVILQHNTQFTALYNRKLH